VKIIAAGSIGPWLVVDETSTAGVLRTERAAGARRAADEAATDWDDIARLPLVFLGNGREWTMKRMLSALLLAAAAMGLALGLVDTRHLGAGGWAAAPGIAQAALPAGVAAAARPR